MTIKYVSAPCGAGKSKAMVQYIKNNPGYRYIIVQPTNKLLNQTADYLDFFKTDFYGIEKKKIKKALLTSDEVSGNLMETIINELGADIGKDVVLITDKMFHRIPVDKMLGFKIFMDDCTDVMSIDVRNIRKKDQDLLRPLYKRMFKTMDYFVVDETKEEEIGINARYSFCKRDTEDFSEDTTSMSNGYRTFDYYHYMVIDNTVFENTSEQISVIGWYDFNRYVKLDLTVMMNNFKSSMIYKMSPDIFIPSELDIKLPDVKHNLSRLQVGYFKNVNRKTDKLSVSKLKSHDLSGIQDYFKDQTELLWTTNKDSRLALPGERIAVQQRGINRYMDFMKFGFFFACNPHPQAIEHLENIFGLTAEDWKEEKEYEEMLQFAFRTNLRDYSSDKPVIGYVYDSDQAEVFKELGAEIFKINVSMQSDKTRKKETSKRDPRKKETSKRNISAEVQSVPDTIKNAFKVWKFKNKARLTTDIYDKWEQRILSKNPGLCSDDLLHLRGQV